MRNWIGATRTMGLLASMALIGNGLVAAPVLAGDVPPAPDMVVNGRVFDGSTLSGGAVAPGTLSVYMFTVENKGKAQATGATFTAHIPSGVQLFLENGFAPTAYFKVASVGLQNLFEPTADGTGRSTCSVALEADLSQTVTCRLGQASGFFYPNLQDGLDILDPGMTNVIHIWGFAPASAGVEVATGNASTNNGDAKPANNVVAVTLEVK